MSVLAEVHLLDIRPAFDEIQAETYDICAGKADEIIRLVKQVLDVRPTAITSKEGWKRVKADHTTASRQGYDLIVGLVPGIVAKLARIGMREGQRSLRKADCMFDRLVAHVRKIDSDPGVLQSVQ